MSWFDVYTKCIWCRQWPRNLIWRAWSDWEKETVPVLPQTSSFPTWSVRETPSTILMQDIWKESIWWQGSDVRTEDSQPYKSTLKAESMKSFTFCWSDARDFQTRSNFQKALSAFPRGLTCQEAFRHHAWWLLHTWHSQYQELLSSWGFVLPLQLLYESSHQFWLENLLRLEERRQLK